MNKGPKYIIYDVRYLTEGEQAATVFDTIDDLEAAFESAGSYGDAVVVDSDTGEVMDPDEYRND